MSNALYQPDQCNLCMDYVKEITDGAPWKCIACGMEEATLYMGKREGVFLWSRYQLACGHQCHERCYRRWCRKEDGVGCPTCGLLPRHVEHAYCRYCCTWGHCRRACPLLHLSFYPTRGKEELVGIQKDTKDRM